MCRLDSSLIGTDCKGKGKKANRSRNSRAVRLDRPFSLPCQFMYCTCSRRRGEVRWGVWINLGEKDNMCNGEEEGGSSFYTDIWFVKLSLFYNYFLSIDSFHFSALSPNRFQIHSCPSSPYWRLQYPTLSAAYYIIFVFTNGLSRLRKFHSSAWDLGGGQ